MRREREPEPVAGNPFRLVADEWLEYLREHLFAARRRGIIYLDDPPVLLGADREADGPSAGAVLYGIVEKDVEEQLVNPLLEQLGYSKEEYERQMRVRMGRGEKVIPDYVVHPTHEAGKETCDFLIETKLTIPTAKQLQIDLGQARSYARRLNAKKLLLASSEGIWIAFAGDDFTATAAYSWFELRGKDIINSVYDSFGNRK